MNRAAPNPVANAMTSTSIDSPDAVTMLSAVTSTILSVTSRDVVTTKSSVPPGVEQDALGERRVVRNAGRDQILAIGQLRVDVAHQELAVLLVQLAYRLPSTRPFGVLLQGVVHPIVEQPAEPEPIPGGIERHPLEQQPDLIRYPDTHHVERQHPLRGPLEDRQMLDVLDDHRHQLHGARTVADYRHATV